MSIWECNCDFFNEIKNHTHNDFCGCDDIHLRENEEHMIAQIPHWNRSATNRALNELNYLINHYNIICESNVQDLINCLLTCKYMK
jgi:hypothetical protein